ncbi:MAG TPA: group I intron-associated PD-(D/E)XK endonuclease [Ktedonosporobacter sp.]|nr:group I intron-associated PD-(D/E)XK endonuclease [Ktedonosporobacter sp.]
MASIGKGKNKFDTNMIGDISEFAIITRFLELGYVILTPFGGNQRCDLIVEDANEQFWRIQCKTGRVNEGKTALIFNTSISNVTGKNRQPRDYRGQCDYFAVYSAELHKCYLVPVDEVGTISARLRLASIGHNHEKREILWAKDYEL